MLQTVRDIFGNRAPLIRICLCYRRRVGWGSSFDHKGAKLRSPLGVMCFCHKVAVLANAQHPMRCREAQARRILPPI